jgi:hypothetical protein
MELDLVVDIIAHECNENHAINKADEKEGKSGLDNRPSYMSFLHVSSFFRLIFHARY